MAATIDWKAVTDFFNTVSDNSSASSGPFRDETTDLIVTVYSPVRNETLKVVVPNRIADEFIKHLPLYEAEIKKGRHDAYSG